MAVIIPRPRNKFSNNNSLLAPPYVANVPNWPRFIIPTFAPRPMNATPPGLPPSAFLSRPPRSTFSEFYCSDPRSFLHLPCNPSDATGGKRKRKCKMAYLLCDSGENEMARGQEEFLDGCSVCGLHWLRNRIVE